MTRPNQQENMMMRFQQQYTKTLEQKERRKFNHQRITLSLNLMTMELNESLTTQPILLRGSKTWEKRQMSKNPFNTSLSRKTW